MNQFKLQTLQKLIIDQSGQERLILNDLILGYEGARVVASMIPEYHAGIHHLEIKGNNLDGDAFEIIVSALLHCHYLKSIMAEWNSIGSSELGLAALSHLTKTLHYLELIDLKNNRICHHLSPYLADIIRANQPSLKVLDLRWNELGELGAQTILAAIPENQSMKFIGLEDNQISTGMLMEI